MYNRLLYNIIDNFNTWLTKYTCGTYIFLLFFNLQKHKAKLNETGAHDRWYFSFRSGLD